MKALLTPEEVANRLRLTPRTIYAWLRQGRLRGKKLGRVWRIRPEDVDACAGVPTGVPKTDEGEGVDMLALFDEICEIMADVPDEEWDKVPPDLGINHDHYLYGSPKRVEM